MWFALLHPMWKNSNAAVTKCATSTMMQALSWCVLSVIWWDYITNLFRQVSGIWTIMCSMSPVIFLPVWASVQRKCSVSAMVSISAIMSIQTRMSMFSLQERHRALRVPLPMRCLARSSVLWAVVNHYHSTCLLTTLFWTAHRLLSLTPKVNAVFGKRSCRRSRTRSTL